MSNYDLTLIKEVTREFAWEVMASIFKLEYINKLLPHLDEMLSEGGLMTIDDVNVIKYGNKPPRKED